MKRCQHWWSSPLGWLVATGLAIYLLYMQSSWHGELQAVRKDQHGQAVRLDETIDRLDRWALVQHAHAERSVERRKWTRPRWGHPDQKRSHLEDAGIIVWWGGEER